MTRDELLNRLNSIEWSDIEFKAASWDMPKSALSTVSAFANTSGGHLVFGIEEKNGTFSISGVVGADKVQNDFLGQVRDHNKVSVFLPIDGELHALDGGTVIVFYVPEAQRSEKPVYLDGNPRKAYIRRGSRDDTCTGEELILCKATLHQVLVLWQPLLLMSIDNRFRLGVSSHPMPSFDEKI